MFDATIITAAWNASDTIERSLRSVSDQGDISVQLVVVDDASDDGTEQVVSVFSDISFDRLRVNGGPAAARNRGLDLAKGEWIAVLDADDTMREGRLSRMIAHARAVDADIVLGNFQHMDEDGNAVEDGPFLRPEGVDPKKALNLTDYVARNQVTRQTKSIGYLKPLISRAFVDRTGLRYDTTLRNGEDCHLIFHALAKGARVIIAPEPDYLYTVRTGSISHRVNPDHLRSLIAADDVFLKQYAGSLDAEALRYFKSRRFGLDEMLFSELVLADLKKKNLSKALIRICGRPRTILRVLRQIFEGLGRKWAAR